MKLLETFVNARLDLAAKDDLSAKFFLRHKSTSALWVEPATRSHRTHANRPLFGRQGLPPSLCGPAHFAPKLRQKFRRETPSIHLFNCFREFSQILSPTSPIRFRCRGPRPTPFPSRPTGLRFSRRAGRVQGEVAQEQIRNCF